MVARAAKVAKVVGGDLGCRRFVLLGFVRGCIMDVSGVRAENRRYDIIILRGMVRSGKQGRLVVAADSTGGGVSTWLLQMGG